MSGDDVHDAAANGGGLAEVGGVAGTGDEVTAGDSVADDDVVGDAAGIAVDLNGGVAVGNPANDHAAVHDAPVARDAAAGAGSHVNREPAPLPRTKRGRHRRVVRKGTEWFDADGVKLEPSDERTAAQREADDDRRILGELPPHWAVFNEKR